MKRWILIALVAVSVGAMGSAGFQYKRLRQAEQILGKNWSNHFALVFSDLGVLNQELHRIVRDGSLGEDTGALLDRTLSAMTVHLTNTLGDARGYLPGVPHVPSLTGYLDQIRESVNVHRSSNVPRPLTAAERQSFQAYADLSTELTALVSEYYPDYPGEGPGFSNDASYWGFRFLSDTRWREVLRRMDAKMHEAGYRQR